MSQPSGPTNPSQPSTSTATGAPRSRPWLWLAPALTFVIGLVLGGVVMAAADTDAGDMDVAAPPAATASAAVASAAATPSARTLTVPASCEQGLDRARSALSTADDALDALRDFNTARLQELLDRLQNAQQEVDRLADQCRSEVPANN